VKCLPFARAIERTVPDFKESVKQALVLDGEVLDKELKKRGVV